MDAELRAFVAWLSTYELSRPVVAAADLSDGLPLFDVLSKVYAPLFPWECSIKEDCANCLDFIWSL